MINLVTKNCYDYIKYKLFSWPCDLCTFLWFSKVKTHIQPIQVCKSYDKLTLIWCIVCTTTTEIFFRCFFSLWQQSHFGKFLTYCQSIVCSNTTLRTQKASLSSPILPSALLWWSSTCICEFWFMVSISPASPQHIWNCIFWQPFWIRLGGRYASGVAIILKLEKRALKASLSQP